MDDPETPNHPITSLLGNTKVQIGIIVVSVFVIWSTDSANRRFNVAYLIGSVIGAIAVAMVIDALVLLVSWIAGSRLSKKQFERYFFGIYSGVIFVHLITSWIYTMSR